MIKYRRKQSQRRIFSDPLQPGSFIGEPILRFTNWLAWDGKFGQDGTKIKSFQLRNNLQTEIIIINYPFAVTVLRAYKEVAPFCSGTKHGKLDLMVILMRALQQ